MGVIMVCDICGERLASYRDSEGRLWDNFTIRERKKRKPKILRTCWEDRWWSELQVCGKCRKALAEYTEGSMK